jgi:probable lipoprotein NlpC
MIFKYAPHIRAVFNWFDEKIKHCVILLTISVLCTFVSQSCGIFNAKKVDNSSRFNTRTVSTIVQKARSYVGSPYKYGGTSADGFDCSGLVTVAFKSANLALPRTSFDMAETGREIDLKNIEVGDLVFFVTSKTGNRINHVGIVTEVNAKDGIKFIHAADSGVREDNLGSKYYKSTFAKAMRPF